MQQGVAGLEVPTRRTVALRRRIRARPMVIARTRGPTEAAAQRFAALARRLETMRKRAQ